MPSLGHLFSGTVRVVSPSSIGSTAFFFRLFIRNKNLAMRLTNLFLALSSSLTLAAPTSPDACCCCDIRQNAISCNTSISASECFCADVACPADATTVWRSEAAAPTPLPPVTTPPDDDGECCCCDPSIPAVSCSRRGAGEICMCADAGCPAGAPTVRPETTTTPPALPEPESTPPVPPTEPLPPNMEKCCCCDISQPAISCRIQDKSVGCFCAFVMCPPDAPTVWPKPQPRPTSTPASAHD